MQKYTFFHESAIFKKFGNRRLIDDVILSNQYGLK